MPAARGLTGPSDQAPPMDAGVLNDCVSTPLTVGPAYILSVTSSTWSFVVPLKNGVWLLVELPLSGLVMRGFGGPSTATARATATGPTATATSEATAAWKTPLFALLMLSCAQPGRRPAARTRSVIMRA